MAVRGQSEFLNLPFKDKLEFLYGLPARQKRDLILAAPEAERLVRSFSPETLFYTLKEIGSADAGDLLSLAMPEQVRSLFDLDCWERDRPNLVRMREWIEALSEAGRKRMADALMGLDLEVVSLLLRQYVKVHRLDDPSTAGELPLNRYVQLDEHYLIEFTRYDSIQQAIAEFLEEAFERDYKYYAGLMEEIYWGVEAELEEQAFQFRRARLSDRGFPDYFEAQSVFSYIDPRRFIEIRNSYEKPSRAELLTDDELIAPEMAPLAHGSENSLLSIALTAGFAAEGRRQLRAEMAMVSNEVLVARAADFGDLDAVREQIEAAHNYMNLGLEHLAGGDLRTAIEHLRDTHLKLLFRLGVSLTIDLRTRTEQLVRGLGLEPRRTREIAYLDSPYREAIAGLLERQPKFFAGLETPGEVALRDFRTMRDVHLGYAMLEQVDAMRGLFRELLGADIGSAAFRAQVAAHEIRLSQILLTALVRLALDGRLAPTPIEASRLAAVRTAVTALNGRAARLSDEFRSLVERTVEERVGESAGGRAEAFVNACLNMLEEEFGSLDPARGIDPRFIRSVLVKRG
jgi:hypothetical protein